MIDSRWKKKINERRIFLIEKELESSLTEAELSELDQLQQTVRKMADLIYPLPVLPNSEAIPKIREYPKVEKP